MANSKNGYIVNFKHYTVIIIVWVVIIVAILPLFIGKTDGSGDLMKVGVGVGVDPMKVGVVGVGVGVG